ncbi:DMT family transporter [Candidatus Dependentiae bacterium]|nr:DMT family transporter [Candidatus Dependentiae bacterium]MBU4387076.1 DMT family transporter [Candidatus Dependentiae bacterium]MCG2756227.1 DMT family transporter [Candidatus Dependentiae bacterium]
MFLVVLLYAILASTFTMAKIALGFAKPFFLIAFRMIVAGTLMLSFVYFFKRKQFFVHKKDWGLFLKTALFHIYISFIFEFWSLQYLTSSKTTLIYSATPFIAALLSYIILSEKLSLKKFIGLVIGILGLVPILLTQTDIRESRMELFSVSLPEITLLIAVISGAYAWFLVKKLLDRGYSLLMINGITMLFGGIGAFFTFLFVDGIKESPVTQIGPFLFWTLLLVLVANIIVYNLYGWLLKKYSITFITSAGFLCPVFGAFYGYIFLTEKITWHYLISLIFIIIGLFVFYKDEIRKKQ